MLHFLSLAQYAAAAIAKSPPIPTGVQGFVYDARTALLPFMFVFNTDLLLLGVDSWLHIGLIFITSTVAMFAFSNITLNFFIVKNRIYETVLLVLVVALLMLPQYFANLLSFGESWGKLAIYILGMALYGVIFLMQKPRVPQLSATAS